jgi:hypothetical protein
MRISETAHLDSLHDNYWHLDKLFKKKIIQKTEFHEENDNIM